MYTRPFSGGMTQIAQPLLEDYDEVFSVPDDPDLYATLEEIREHRIINDKVLFKLKYVGEEESEWIDYHEFYSTYPEAAITFFRGSELSHMFPNGIIGNPLPPEEKEMNRNN
jgi:hypothetical protein